MAFCYFAEKASERCFGWDICRVHCNLPPDPIVMRSLPAVTKYTNVNTSCSVCTPQPDHKHVGMGRHQQPVLNICPVWPVAGTTIGPRLCVELEIRAPTGAERSAYMCLERDILDIVGNASIYYPVKWRTVFLRPKLDRDPAIVHADSE